MNKPTQALYAVRDFIYTLALAVFGWLLADYKGLFADPIGSIGTFFSDFWNVFFFGLVIFAYIIEMVFTPGMIRPRDEEPIPWRRWKGMLMESNLVPAIFCARLGVLQITHGNAVRYVGVFFFVVSLVVTVLYGIKRSQKIKEAGDNTYCVTGIYNKVRYPEHLAQVFYALAVAFILRSWLSLIAVILLIRWLNSWLGRLDKYMEEKYGGDWSIYAAKTKKFIPYLI
jgi:protein-S-isoprenylcysteine O-methyltransferase Ste14